MEIKKSTLKWGTTSLVIVALIIVGIVTLGHHSTGTANATSSAPTKQSASPNSGSPFSSSPYSRVAYQIFPGPLSSNTKTALAGVQLTSKQNSDGTTTVTLTPSNANYNSWSYTAKSGDKIYFIETSFGEDNPSSNYDGIYGDDGAIVVNSAGYIIQGPTVV